MTVALYNQALDILSKNEIDVDYNIPAADDLVSSLERHFGHPLPESYKAMLRQHGILAFEGTTIYGLGKTGLDGQSAPSVIFTTDKSRKAGEISSTMVRIMASGYGPFFVLECAEIDDQGEAPVYEIPMTGYQDGMKKVADSFDEFLLNEVNMNMES
ncbi:SMI1/KNR4 family protein [Paracoccus onubensis]|uniref:SMI1/KNR4 family protein n=1 Tax=Paracoccus onubensis TaxID=1675788 RepID=UPI00273038FB|nr:SMI1/KNR4 family protein [Paracoccus onubensis]MDP0930198.1 SMI1/KNR4 family protein [Paracoccus onubensis]